MVCETWLDRIVKVKHERLFVSTRFSSKTPGLSANRVKLAERKSMSITASGAPCLCSIRVPLDDPLHVASSSLLLKFLPD